MSKIHELYRVTATTPYAECERELLVETAHSEPKEIHIGVWPVDGSFDGGMYVPLTPEQALELGENIVRRALAAMIDNEHA